MRPPRAMKSSEDSGCTGITGALPSRPPISTISPTFTGLAEGTTSLGNTVEISSLTADRTITANFSMAFFSASTAEKDLVPVRIRSARDKAYTLRLNTNDNYTGKAVNSGVTAYGENELWYLVGTKESFKIYNRVAGTSLHIVLAGTGEGSAASMNNTANNADYCLVTKDNGYAICPKGNTGQSFNMYGGAGADIKLYGAGDGGSIWTIEKMDVTKPLTLNVEVDLIWESSPRVAELTFTIDGLAGQTRILGSVEGQKLYIPTGATYEVSSMTYRGYTYNGCTEKAGVLTASYTANDERTLFYSPRDGHPYRIPAIATAANGDVFAICDYRPCGNDIGYGEVDIKCRISTDNGFSWGEEFFVADGKGGNTNEMTTGYGDAAIVADCQQNKLLVMMVAGRTVCHNGRWDKSKIGNKTADAVNRVARVYATYNEETKTWDWTQPEEVTDHIYSLFLDGETPTVTSMFIGSGKICQSRVVKKNEYYRLYCSMWTRDEGNRVIYSDDFGGTWNVLGTINDRPAAGGDEPKVEELPDGTVVLSSRKYSGRYFNLFTFDDNITLTLNNQNVPQLRVSGEFMQMLDEQAASTHADSRNAAQFLRQKIESARDFIHAIQQREQTLTRTMEAIIALQRPFFLEGDESLLRPLILKDVAEYTGYDISTISRATISKYVQTPFGIFPLRYFFSDGITNAEGEEVSVKEVHNIIKELVAAEDKVAPLTDEQLVEALAQRGFKVARRTIAKYRDQLHIPVARMRR